MASAIQYLLDSIKDGIMIVNLAGKLVFANQSARQSFPGQLQIIAEHADLKKAIADAATGKVNLPINVRLSIGTDALNRTTLVGTLIPAPNNVDYVYIIHAGLRSDEYTNSLHNFFELIRQELRQPILDFLKLIAPQQSDQSPVTDHAKEIINRLEKLIDVVEIFGDDALISDDRIVVKDLVTDVWKELAPLASNRRVEASLVGFNTDLPPIYGSYNWLRRAVRECLENAIIHSRQEISNSLKSHVEIRAKQSGQHLMVIVRNLGVGLLPKLADRVFLPFNRAGLPKASPTHGMSIGLPLAQRILELHGGQIRINHSNDSATELTLELPTGAPQRDSTKLDIQQAQRYAEDLAKLMVRRKKRTTSMNPPA